jgi:hypothetical protein
MYFIQQNAFRDASGKYAIVSATPAGAFNKVAHLEVECFVIFIAH